LTTALDTRALATQMECIGIVPVLVIDRVEDARPVADALAGAGCRVLEITLRTEAALDAIAVLAEHPSLTVGRRYGAQCRAGERGLRGRRGVPRRAGVRQGDGGICALRRCADRAGIATASELQAAWNFGLEFVKVFPASTIGGPAALRMLASICAGMRFMPTGGIGVDDLADYLAIPAVLACGGTWLASASAIAERDFDGIASRAATAVAIARQARNSR
jgi:2-dehydro-3-deoxyphosphogluconate aldolase/(4S)-4-hydroxy-2-oxoglutarate aldolase